MSPSIVEVARELAARAHADHRRKSGNLLYFSHLAGVARLTAEHGYTDDATLAAAYLHDLLEDRPAFGAEMRRCMPVEVVEAVEALSEPKIDALGQPLPKQVRFEHYLAKLSLPGTASARALPISCADKIHNMLSVVEAEGRGERLLLKLNTRPDQQLAQLKRLRELYVSAVVPSLLVAYDAACAQLGMTIEACLAGRATSSAPFTRNLQLRLTAESRALAQKHARLPVLKGDHVTLAHRVDPATPIEVLLGEERSPGALLEFRASAECYSEAIQVWVIELSGESVRRSDHGVLHLTVSRSEAARSRDSNALLEHAARAPVDVQLHGTLEWVDH